MCTSLSSLSFSESNDATLHCVLWKGFIGRTSNLFCKYLVTFSVLVASTLNVHFMQCGSWHVFSSNLCIEAIYVFSQFISWHICSWFSHFDLAGCMTWLFQFTVQLVWALQRIGPDLHPVPLAGILFADPDRSGGRCRHHHRAIVRHHRPHQRPHLHRRLLGHAALLEKGNSILGVNYVVKYLPIFWYMAEWMKDESPMIWPGNVQKNNTSRARYS